MALTITEQFRMDAGGRKFRFHKITQDETTSTIAAASLDLDYIEFCLAGQHYFASTPADMSTLVNYMTISITGDNDQIEITLPAKAASTFSLLTIGW